MWITRFFTIMIIRSMLSICKWQHVKVVNTPARLKTHSISICEHGIPRIYFAKKPTFGNWPLCIRHQVSGSTHVDEKIDSLPNINNSLIINVWKDSSIEAPTPNMFSSNSNPASSTIIVTTTILGSNVQNTPSKMESQPWHHMQMLI